MKSFFSFKAFLLPLFLLVASMVQAQCTATITPAGPTTFCQGGSVVLNANRGDTWTQKAAFGGVKRRDATGFRILNKGYIGLGFWTDNSYHIHKDFWEYDPTSDIWTQKQDFPGTERYDAPGFSVGGKGYVGTGYHDDFYEFDPLANIWLKKAQFTNSDRFGAIGFSIGTKGYIGTGRKLNTVSLLSDFWEYDYVTDSWTQKANFSGSYRRDATGFSIGGKGYIGTGLDNVGHLHNDFWEYDPATDIWTKKADFPGEIRQQATGFNIGNKGYIGTGMYYTQNQIFNDFWEYNPATDIWTKKADFGGSERWSATGFSIGGKGYIGTGIDDYGFKTDFWEYTPSFSYLWSTGATTQSITVNTNGNYTVTVTNAAGCSVTSAVTSVTVQGAGAPSSTPTLCVNTTLTNITHTTTDVFGIGAATGLPAGVTAALSSNKITISGTPSAGGIFNYSIPLIVSGCNVNATGRIMVNAPNATITPGGSTTFCAGGSVVLNADSGNSWTPKTAFGGTARMYAAGFSIGSKGYIGTGIDDASGNKKDFWEYDPATDTWTQKADFDGTARYGATGFSIGSKGYIGTGDDGSSKSDFWEYDPATNTWKQRADFGGTARFFATGFSSGGKGYIGTGQAGNSERTDFWEYNPTTDIWTQKSAFGGTARSRATGFSIGSKGYIGTGRQGLSKKNDFWEYNPSSDTWIPKAAFGGSAREYASGFSIGSRGYIGTGNDGDRKNDIWEYNPAADSWTKKADFGGTIRYGAIAFSIEGKGYIGTGYDNNKKNDFWEYTPSVSYLWSTGAATQSINTGTGGNYSVTVTDVAMGCSATSAATTVTITANNTAGVGSSNPTVCINTAIAAITHTTTGATGIGAATNLPAGVSASFASNTITISGTPTALGIFNYSIPLTGGCGSVNATGRIIVSTSATVGSYANTSVVAGQNTTITPSAAPTTTTYMAAYTNTNFTGVLSVNPTTGVLKVTDAKQAGTYLVSIAAGCTAAPAFTLTVTNPACSQGLFSGTTNVAVGTTPLSIAVGDFNGDGKHDIATANYSGNTVSIRLGNGAGGFSGTTSISVGTNPYGIAVGDFNGDGKQDIATANNGNNTVSIRLGDGAGGFSGTTNISVGTNPYKLAVGDFNGDGKLDIATANAGNSTVSIRLGDGAGGFSGTTNVAVGSSPVSVAVGDFNGDGKQDIAAANYNSNTVSIRLGNGAGGFSGTTNVAVGTSPVSVAVGDFNGDGKQDIATANYDGNTVSIRLGDGAGSFSGTTNLTVGSFPRSVAVGDFNGDGKQDIAAANYSSNTVSIRLGDGAGSFSGTTNVSVGSGPISVAVGDFNDDGSQDIAVANGGNSTVSTRLGGAALINLQGNSTNIVNGSSTPSLTNATDFGTACMGSSNVVKTFTIQNTGSSNLTISAAGITVSGADASMFTVGGISLPVVIPVGSSTTFTVSFAPSSTGVKSAQVSIANNSCTIPAYTFAIGATVAVNSTVGAASSAPTACTNTAITTITHSTTGATGIGAATNLPAGVSASFASNTITISGTPTATGTFNYSIPLTGGCEVVNATGTITVNALPAAIIAPGGPTTFCPGGSVVLNANNSDTWTTKTAFGGAARGYAVSFSIGSKGYIGTGYDGANKNDLWEYNPIANTWTQKADFGGTARRFATGFSIGSKGYIGTGVDGNGLLNDFWEYDPAANTWIQKAPFGGTARQGATGFNIGNKGYIGTGDDGANKNDFWEYNPVTDTWTQKAVFGGTARGYATGFSIGSKGYIGTGFDGSARNDFWEYNPATDTWTSKAAFGGTARNYATGFSIGSKGYIGIGYDGSAKNDFWEYSPPTDTWAQKAVFGGTARYRATGFSIGSKGYIGTGEDGGFTNDFWEYTPSLTYLWSTGATTPGISAAASGNYSVTVTETVTGCSATSAEISVMVKSGGISITPASSTVCATADALQLIASVVGDTSQTILSENFNAAINGWTTINNSTGGTPAAAAWTLTADGYIYDGDSHYSNDNSQFYMSNSDAAGFGSTTNTLLVSPAFSTVGFAAVNVSFYHYFRFYSTPDIAKVEVSTDNVNWTMLKAYTANQGTHSTFAQENAISLTAAFLNKPTVYLRFNYSAPNSFRWAIDNVLVTGIQAAPITWSPTAGLFTDAAAQNAYAGTNTNTVYAKPEAAGSYAYTATTSVNGCYSSGNASIVVNAAPSTVTITPSSGTICATSSALQLTASGGGVGQTILSADFNGATNTWTTLNNSTGGAPAEAAWTLRPNGFSYDAQGFNSNDNTQFYMSNSDAQGAGGTTNTKLVSPAFSTVGLAGVHVSFYHYFVYYGNPDIARVEVSTDNISWTTVKFYTATVGFSQAFVQESAISLPAAFINKPAVYLRFNYSALYGNWWAIDNVLVSGTQPTWSPTAGLFTDAAAQNAYTGTNANTVYAKPGAAGSYTYTATSAFANGCTASGSANITVNANNTSTAALTPTLCINSPLTNITHTTTGATGISNSGVSGANGLPAGVSAAFASNTITISGTPTAAGTFNYSIPLTGGCGTVSATGMITVNNLQPIASITGGTSVCLTNTKQLSCSTPGGVWSSSDTTKVKVDVTSGIITGVAGGVANITYTVSNGGCSSSVSISISVITTIPTVATISGNRVPCAGTTTQLTNATAGGTWAILNPSIATISSTGLVTAITAGTTTVTYTTLPNSSGCTRTATAGLTVKAIPTVAAITGNNGVCIGNTTQLNNVTTGGTWSSITTGVATISTTGLVTSVAVGTTTITYTTAANSSGCVNKATLLFSVTPFPTLTSAVNLTTCSGYTFTYSPVANVSGTTFIWTRAAVAGISNASVSTPQNGNINEVLINTTSSPVSVVYVYVLSVNGCSTTQNVMVTVNPSPDAVAPITGVVAVCGNNTSQLSTTTTGGTWSSTNTSVATVSNTGLVTRISNGTTIISYTVTNGFACNSSATVLFTVNPAPTIASITGGNSVCITNTKQLSCATAGGTWSSSDTTKVKVNATSGVITGIAGGSAVITYTVAPVGVGCTISTSATITVLTTLPTVATILGTRVVCLGLTTTLTNATPGGTWRSSNPAIASVSSTGVVTGNAVGTCNINYTTAPNSSGCTRTATVSYAVRALPTVAPVTGNNGVCAGGTTQLANATTGGTWSSNNTGVATVSSTGLVSGVTAGTVTITYTTPPNTNGCINTATMLMTVNPNSGITGITAANNPVCSNSTTTLTATGVTGVGTVVTWWKGVGIDSLLGTGITLSNVSAEGTYYATVTNECGTASAEASIVVTSKLASGSDTTASACSTFTWRGSTYTNSGDYTFKLTNSVGCDSIRTLHLTIRKNVMTATITNPLCYNAATGIISVSASGGTAPYLYKNGAAGVYGTNSNFTGLRAGSFTIFAQDATGCASSQVFVITQPTAVSATSTKVDATCPGASNGSITVNGAGGTAPYTYRYGSTGAFTSVNTFSNLKAGSYRIFVNDANGCTGYSIVVVVGNVSTTCPSIIPIAKATDKPAIAEGNKVMQVSIYPNPSNNQFTVVAHTNKKEAVHVRVLDINGRTVYQQKGLAEQSFKFGAALISGMYLVEVRQGDEMQTVKAMKIK